MLNRRAFLAGASTVALTVAAGVPAMSRGRPWVTEAEAAALVRDHGYWPTPARDAFLRDWYFGVDPARPGGDRGATVVMKARAGGQSTVVYSWEGEARMLQLADGRIVVAGPNSPPVIINDDGSVEPLLDTLDATDHRRQFFRRFDGAIVEALERSDA